MSNLASCRSVWNWPFTQHPQSENWNCMLYQLDNHIAFSSYVGIKRSEIINIYVCRSKCNICFLNWLLHGNSDQITCLGWAILKEVVAGGISPFTILPIREIRFIQQQKPGSTLKAVAHTEGSLLPSLWSPAVIIFLLKEPFPWSCTMEMQCGSVLAGLYGARTD